MPAEIGSAYSLMRPFGSRLRVHQSKVSLGRNPSVVSACGLAALERRDMDEFVALVRDRDDPGAGMRAFMQQATTELRRSLVGRTPGDDGIWQIDPFLIPDELLL
jgi:hypothetical protein